VLGWFDFKAAYSARRARGPLCVLLAGVILSGCAISTPLGPIFGSSEDKTTTGSIPDQDNRLSASMTDADWDKTKLALQAAMSPQNPGASILWSNPDAGTHGSVTPVADAFVENKSTCRSFVAALTQNVGTQWYQGRGCQRSSGSWTIVNVQPWALPHA
jgi:surface antigen